MVRRQQEHRGGTSVPRRRGIALLAVAVILAVASCGSDGSDESQDSPTSQGVPVPDDTQAVPPPEPLRVLVFHNAAGYVHKSIPDAVTAIEKLGVENDLVVDATSNPTDLETLPLDEYDTVVFVSTTGNVVPDPGPRAALERFIQGGGGFVGVHAASDMGDVASGWPWYRDLVGAEFKGHTAARVWSSPPIDSPSYAGPFSEAPPDAEVQAPGAIASSSWEPAKVLVEDTSAPAMAGWGESQVRSDEWYGFIENPRPFVHVLATVDESSYDPAGGEMGEDHPIAWCHAYDGGRSFYTAMGHTTASWSEPLFLSHILGAIEMVGGRASFDCDPPVGP